MKDSRIMDAVKRNIGIEDRIENRTEIKARHVGVLTSLAVAACIFVGCATTRSVTNKDPAYTRQATRLFVVSNVQIMGTGFVADFERKVATEIRLCGGELEASHVSELELDDSARTAQMARFKPDTLVTIRVSGGTKDQYGVLINANFDTRVWDVESKKTVWRASSRMATGGMFSSPSQRAESLSTDLVAKLRADKILPMCAEAEAAAAAAAAAAKKRR